MSCMPTSPKPIMPSLLRYAYYACCVVCLLAPSMPCMVLLLQHADCADYAYDVLYATFPY